MRHRLQIALVTVIVTVIVTVMMAGAFGQAFAKATPDDQAVRALVARYETAWNSHDMKILGAITTEDVDFINAAGSHWKGREDVVRRLVKLHQGIFKNSVLTTEAVSVELLRPDLALVHVDWATRGDVNAEGKSSQPRKGIFTWLVVEQSGAWKIRSAQNTNKR